jgi:hypothetical protein
MDALDSMTDEQCTSAFMGLYRDSDLTRYVIANAVTRTLAIDLAYEANHKAAELAEPEDVDDIIYADRRAARFA